MVSPVSPRLYLVAVVERRSPQLGHDSEQILGSLSLVDAAMRGSCRNLPHQPGAGCRQQYLSRAAEVFVGVVPAPHFFDGQVENRGIQSLAVWHGRQAGTYPGAAAASS